MSDEVRELEAIIKNMVKLSGNLCSIMVASEVISSIPNNRQAKKLLTAMTDLHRLCASPRVDEIFNRHESNGNG